MNPIGALGAIVFAVVTPRLPRSIRRAGVRHPVLSRAEWERGFRRRSDVEFRQLLERLPVAAYTCDAEGLITYYNEAAVRLWGREPLLNDPRDRWCGSFRLYAADGTPIDHDACWMALALRDDREYNNQEIRIEREGGEMLTALAHANPLHDERGRVIGAVNVLIDITDRKRMETMLRDADRAKDEFLAMLGHELRNPLAPMHAALELMRRAPDASAGEAARGTLERQLQHMTRVVDDLVDLSRISRNALELRLARVELASVIHQAVETARPLAACVDHRLEVSMPAEPIFVEGDSVRLAQLISNLLNNACKYTDASGLISLTVERHGSDAAVSVRDNGRGIPPDVLPSVFDLFVRGGDGDEARHEGLGVGLTLARRIAELHGGSIEAHSDGPGRGAEFRVRLPVALDAATVPAAPADAARNGAAAPGRRLRVLVVDDNRDAAEALAELLKLVGHEVHMAHDGAAAVEDVERLHPDLVLLDIGLPRLDGYDAARRIRERNAGADMMLIAVTGWGQAEDRRRSREAGFDRHLTKPVEFAVLEQILDEVAAERAPAPS